MNAVNEQIFEVVMSATEGGRLNGASPVDLATGLQAAAILLGLSEDNPIKKTSNNCNPQYQSSSAVTLTVDAGEFEDALDLLTELSAKTTEAGRELINSSLNSIDSLLEISSLNLCSSSALTCEHRVVFKPSNAFFNLLSALLAGNV